jgi:hypothetical protein
MCVKLQSSMKLTRWQSSFCINAFGGKTFDKGKRKQQSGVYQLELFS